MAYPKLARYVFDRMSSKHVTVFGGTGFLGSRIVRRLRDADFVARIASRYPERSRSLLSRHDAGIEAFRADVNDDGSVTSAVAGAWAVVNAVSLYVESGKCTFHSVHVEAAKRIANLARQAYFGRHFCVSLMSWLGRAFILTKNC